MATTSNKKLLAKVERLETQLAERERTIRRLRARLGKNAPKANAPSERAEPEAPGRDAYAGDGEEELYYPLIGLLPDAVVICNQAGRLQFVNAAGVQMLGAREAADLLGRSFWAFIPDDEREVLRERQRLLLKGQRVDFFEHHVQALGGGRVPVETASTPIRYRGRPAVLIAARDLRQRRQVERALSETQDLFYNAFHLGPAALTITRLSDGAYIDVNERFEELTGYTRDEVVGGTVHDFGLWVNPQVREAALREVRKHGRVRDVESQLRRKDGSARFVITSAQRAEIEGESCLLTSTFDITRRRQAQKAERESRALLYKIFHASPAAISISQISDGRFIDVNDEMARLFGYDREEMIGRTVSDLHAWLEPARREELVEQIEREEALHDYEIEVRTRSGEPLNMLYSLQRIQVQGTPCLLAVGVDITARTQVEAALREAKERAEELAQLRSGMLTNMTHEVRTPLTVILGFTSILRQGVSKKYERFVDLIERSGRRLLLTLDSVLDLAQLEAGTLEVKPMHYNVLNLVSNAAAAFRPIAEDRGLAFHLNLPSTGLYVPVDYEVLLRALNHVLDNAAKFTEKGSVTLSVRSDDDSIYIDIEDTGIGIEKDFLDHVFDSFAQESTGLNRSYQGSGIGLTVSKKLIERTGGSLRVESQKGEGSIFTIKLPRSEHSAVAVSG